MSLCLAHEEREVVKIEDFGQKGNAVGDWGQILQNLAPKCRVTTFLYVSREATASRYHLFRASREIGFYHLAGYVSAAERLGTASRVTDFR